MISGRFSKLVSKVTSFFNPKPRVSERKPAETAWPTPVVPFVTRGIAQRERTERGGLAAKVRKVERQRRAWQFKQSRTSHLLPPQTGSRRAEFSSPIPGQWGKAAQ